jgi:hypothetical protein
VLGSAADFFLAISVRSERCCGRRRPVLDYIDVTDKARARYLQLVVNPSRHEPWQEYYIDRLAASVYRAYERDFDKFSYPRTIK